MKTDRFKKQLWIGIIIILASIGVAVGGLYYFSGDLDLQASKIVTGKQEIAAQANEVGQLASLEGQAPVAAAYESAFGQLFPDQYGLVTFGHWLNGIAAKDGVTATVSFGTDVTAPQGSSPGTAPFTLSVTGAPGNITSFLKDAESQSAGFLFNLDSFDLTNSGGEGQLNAQGTAFFRS